MQGEPAGAVASLSQHPSTDTLSFSVSAHVTAHSHVAAPQPSSSSLTTALRSSHQPPYWAEKDGTSSQQSLQAKSVAVAAMTLRQPLGDSVRDINGVGRQWHATMAYLVIGGEWHNSRRHCADLTGF